MPLEKAYSILFLTASLLLLKNRPAPVVPGQRQKQSEPVTRQTPSSITLLSNVYSQLKGLFKNAIIQAAMINGAT